MHKLGEEDPEETATFKILLDFFAVREFVFEIFAEAGVVEITAQGVESEISGEIGGKDSDDSIEGADRTQVSKESKPKARERGDIADDKNRKVDDDKIKE